MERQRRRDGFPEALIAAQAHGLLSVEPVPLTDLASNGRYMVVSGRVMFVVGDGNHATALAGSGLAPSERRVSGFYNARRWSTDEPWEFFGVSHWGSGRLPTPESHEAARRAFMDSGWGDIRSSLSR